MSNPDPNIVQEMAEEIDALDFGGGAIIPIGERVDVSDPTVSTPDEEYLGSDPSSAHRRRLRVVKVVEERLSKTEGLKWYEIVGSYLDHGKADLIRERSGMPAGFDLAMPSAEDRAHKPSEGYHFL